MSFRLEFPQAPVLRRKNPVLFFYRDATRRFQRDALPTSSDLVRSRPFVFLQCPFYLSMSLAAALVNRIARRVAVLFTSRNILRTDNSPAGRIDVREMRITVDLGQHMGDMQAVGKRQRLRIDLTAADDAPGTLWTARGRLPIAAINRSESLT